MQYVKYKFYQPLYFQDYLPKNKNFRTHLQLNFGSGLPFGPPGENLVQRNAVRFKTYQRVDIGFSYQLWDEINRDEKPHNLFKFTRKTWISLEVFNLLDISNTISYLWVTNNKGDSFAVPNYLTRRKLNLKLTVKF